MCYNLYTTGATDQAAEGVWRWQGSGELVGDFVWTSGVLTIHKKIPGHHYQLSITCHSDRYGSSGPYSSPDYTELDMNYMYLDFKSPEFPPAAGYATYDTDLGAKYPICQMPYI